MAPIPDFDETKGAGFPPLAALFLSRKFRESISPDNGLYLAFRRWRMVLGQRTFLTRLRGPVIVCLFGSFFLWLTLRILRESRYAIYGHFPPSMMEFLHWGGWLAAGLIALNYLLLMPGLCGYPIRRSGGISPEIYTTLNHVNVTHQTVENLWLVGGIDARRLEEASLLDEFDTTFNVFIMGLVLIVYWMTAGTLIESLHYGLMGMLISLFYTVTIIVYLTGFMACLIDVLYLRRWGISNNIFRVIARPRGLHGALDFLVTPFIVILSLSPLTALFILAHASGVRAMERYSSGGPLIFYFTLWGTMMLLGVAGYLIARNPRVQLYALKGRFRTMEQAVEKWLHAEVEIPARK